MARIPQTSIEQWAVLRVIVDTGGFAQAAEHLHRSQSSVSYAVARLQDRLGVKLLQIDGRKANLTEAGRMLLADVSILIDDLMRLEDRARFVTSGNEATVRLLVDSIFPKRLLFAALGAFETVYPHVQVELLETIRQTVPDPIEVRFDLAISASAHARSDARRLLDVILNAVVRHDHPIQKRKVLTKATLSRHRLVAIRDERPDAKTARGSEDQSTVWRVNSVDAAIEAVTSGLCYGWLPRHLIEAELASGELVVLPLGSRAVRLIPLTLSFADEDRAGPSTCALADLLLQRAATSLTSF